MADLTVKYAGIEFKNPVVAVSGPLGRTFEALKRSIEAGCGAVTLKSNNATPKEQGKYIHSSHEIAVKPAHVFLGKHGLTQSMINWEGVPSDFTADDERDLILKIKPIAEKHNCRIIANIHPDPAYLFDLDMYREDISKLLSAGPDLLEICPCPYHFPDVGGAGDDVTVMVEPLKMAYQIAIEEADKINVPVIGKANLPVFSLLPDVLKEVGMTTIHITEGPFFAGTVVDIETMKPLCPGSKVFTYGRHRRPVMNLHTAKLKGLYGEKTEIIASSGIWTASDCIERMMCGAHLVGLHTAIQFHGQKHFTKVIAGISDYLERKGLSVNQVIGAAVADIVSDEVHEEFMVECDLTDDQIQPKIDLEACNGCGKCENCIHGAIEMEEELPKLFLDLCMRCGVCESICPTDCIEMARV